ncbi:MAG: bifunctional adenosylcobinamide kinase/adenosylcobinamide-phosphate guanylyltransferase [Desulfobacterales bacterium]|nr:bifunctional adenosylcobinamide kinase/adenosylcobinamide-phosphate guanylyltransferase [Desulfobacterales bacterium]
MGEALFVLGGCRSGKSRFALQKAEGLPYKKRIFIATCIPQDLEMKDRVKNHQIERDQSWVTVESPIRLTESIDIHDDSRHVILIDCLTLWVSNLMMTDLSESNIRQETEKLMERIRHAKSSIVLVSNEVGLGIVPDNALARSFRDIVGYVNQQTAIAAHHVYFMIAGIPMCIKSS